jgi:RNA polymerase-binding transcription factor DksA
VNDIGLPAWRKLLESRWQRRLADVIRLSVAYHDASERAGGGQRTADTWLSMAVAARRALSETEEALARLSAGDYGKCEQCGARIPVAELAAEPEARYCGRCIGHPSEGELREVGTWRG